MSTKARKRVLADYKYYQRNPPSGITCRIHEDNMLIWDACIIGPEDTPWEGGTFFLRIEISEQYPETAPSIRFVNHLFHPNIYVDGHICLDILQNRWTPQYNIVTVLLSIQSLLNDPNPLSPANQAASSMYSNHREMYYMKVRECVERSWFCEKASRELLQDAGKE